MRCICGRDYEYTPPANGEYNKLDDMCSRCRGSSQSTSSIFNKEYEHSSLVNAPFLSHINNNQ